MKMQQRIILSLVALFSLLTLGVTPVVSADSDSTDSTTSNSAESESSTDKSKEEKIEANKHRLEILEKHKDELKKKVSAIEQKRIKDRCKQAQNGGIKSLDGRVKGIETSRGKVHANLVNKLSRLVEKLKIKGVDTAALESEIAVLKTKIETFKADLATYKQNLAELKAMDCATDPIAFKAQLEIVRSDREKLHQDVIDIRKYVKETIKPTLKEIRNQLEEKEKTETESENQANNTAGGSE